MYKRQALRSPEGTELAYVRARFLLECRAFKVEPIDCPFNFRDVQAAQADMQWAWQLGFRSKCVTHAHHVAAVHKRLTPHAADCAQARDMLQRWALQKQGVQPADAPLVDSPMFLAHSVCWRGRRLSKTGRLRNQRNG